MANDKQKKGFAGLDSMISEVELAPGSSAQPIQEELIEPSNRPVDETTAAEVPRQVFTGPSGAGPNAGISGKGWLLIAIGVIVLVAWFANSGKQSNSPPAVPYESSGPLANDGPTLEASEPSITVPSTENEEAVAPVGSGLTLDRSQIRYCLSQKVRLEAWHGQLNENPQSSVDAFNASVDFYNTRCSNYRYHTSDFESVRAEVESNRAALTQQGVSMAASIDASSATNQHAPAVRTSFDCTKARSDAEHIICTDGQLAAADVDLANLFASAKAVTKDQTAFKEHVRERWNERERSCHDRDCLVQWYASQRQWLTDVLNNSNAAVLPYEPASSPSAATSGGNCGTAVECAKAMLLFAGAENLAGAMNAAQIIDSLPKPRRGDRTTARKLNQEGLSALNASRPDDAVKLLEQATQADPGDEEIVSNLAYAYAVSGQLAKSEDTAVVALSINPRRTNVWAPLAETLAKENRQGQAVEAMWLAYQFSTDKQRTLNFIDSRLASETDPAVVKMFSSSKAWLIENKRPDFQ